MHETNDSPPVGRKHTLTGGLEWLRDKEAGKQMGGSLPYVPLFIILGFWPRCRVEGFDEIFVLAGEYRISWRIPIGSETHLHLNPLISSWGFCQKKEGKKERSEPRALTYCDKKAIYKCYCLLILCNLSLLAFNSKGGETHKKGSPSAYT